MPLAAPAGAPNTGKAMHAAHWIPRCPSDSLERYSKLSAETSTQKWPGFKKSGTWRGASPVPLLLASQFSGSLRQN
ncbi:hypothetical protein PCASD_25152 [Puccinia coronata f. sp. avenae]|uniref:Uncharacterized protein n=1 Tax=Puccinia coronata f. sp. avenae TaxID=200324 RepID=A0A2N5SI22_9BASI|nr:hypothetical protein PCASD_25152 [Puccinia coronata f. sp. avenae]